MAAKETDTAATKRSFDLQLAALEQSVVANRNFLQDSGEPPCLQSLKELTFNLPSSRHLTPYGRHRMATAGVRSPETLRRISSSLRRELQRIRSVPMHCDLAPVSSSTSSNPMGVMRVERPASAVLKPFHCHLCPKRFARKHVLENHVRTHTGERPFKCPTCLKDFARKDYLNYHVRTCRCRR
ncbi:uncharacterized protein LOC144107113 [Amblyomma americanum]